MSRILFITLNFLCRQNKDYLFPKNTKMKKQEKSCTPHRKNPLKKGGKSCMKYFNIFWKFVKTKIPDMESSSKVIFNLNQFFYHSHNYDWTNEMPFFWFCFFKIDGTNCRLNESLILEGKTSLYTPLEKIETLNNLVPDQDDAIQIPEYIGKKEIVIKPIPIPEFIKESTIKKPEPQIGCVTIFMNRNCFLADWKNELPTLLSSTLQAQLDKLIPTLNHKNTALVNKNKPLANLLETTILNSSQKQQPFWKKFISENRVDATIWKFSASELAELQTISLTKNWTNEGTWELSGNISLEKESVSPYPTFSIKNKSTQKRNSQVTHWNSKNLS